MTPVYLVGGGPGDPDLITWKGRKALASADVILYDHLAPEGLLALAPAHCEKVYVGKKKAIHACSQEEICQLLIGRARLGLRVVRLKGGDPFIFGRGGEEAEALAEAGIPFEVVPGVTAPLGIAAYAGVPLTHREHTSVVTFVTGHAPGSIDWDRVGHAETLVVFMGLTAIHEIAREIISRGRPASTPALAVRWGTRPDQQTVVGTLGDLGERIEAAGLRPPATVIIGDVVLLRDRLNWFEKLPLFGQQVVVTRARDQADDLSSRLRALGAEPLELPVIETAPPADPAPLDAALERLRGYHWVIFTSVNGVRFFFDRLDQSPFDIRRLRARICAIGPATRAALEPFHLKVDRMPESYVAEALVAAFAGEALAGQRILLPRAAVARDVIPEQLRQLGAEVDVVEAYRTVPPADLERRAQELFSRARKPDWITLTSSSTVKNLLAAAGREPLEGARFASIGPVTSETARRHDLPIAVEATDYTIAGLVAAIAAAPRDPDYNR